MQTDRLITRGRTRLGFWAALLLIVGLTSCGGSNSEGDTASSGNAKEDAGGLSTAQLEHGIGPITTVNLTTVDTALAESGEQIFQTKCATCHKFDQRYVGPSLDGILDRRSPAFVMNMMLNPAEMVEKHPEVKKMLAEFLTPMPNQNLSEEDARAILEYIRHVSANANS